MNSDYRSRQFDLADDFGLFGHRRAEDVAVKCERPVHVRGPDDVFRAFDVHGGNLSLHERGDNRKAASLP